MFLLFKANLRQPQTDLRDEYPISFGDELGNIKWEHESEGDSYFLGKKFYYIYCIPVGESKWVTKFDRRAHGYYEVCDIEWNPNKRLKPVANKGSSGVLQWDDPNLETAHIDSEMLKYLRAVAE